MTKKTRLIIFIICAILFFIITPYVLLYSLGYRVDFNKLTVVATGGIYIKAFPQEVAITIDSKISDKTSIFSNSFFVQDLLPGKHSILVKKDGYYNYQKELPVKENEVTKLEHIVLIKQTIPFTLLDANTDDFYITPDEKNLLLAKSDGKKIDPVRGQGASVTAQKNQTSNGVDFEIIALDNQQAKTFSLAIANGKINEAIWSGDSSKALLNINGRYYLLQHSLPIPQITLLPYLAGATLPSFNPQDSSQIFYIKNKNLYANQNTVPAAQNAVAYQIANNHIIFLSYDGLLYNINIADGSRQKISTYFPVKNKSNYKIIANAKIIFLKEDASLFLLNQTSQIFEKFYGPVNDVKTSPDGQKILFYNDRQIAYFSLSDVENNIFLNDFSEKISDGYWMGNDYVILVSGGKITISETDDRGNINRIDLPSLASLTSGKNINIESPKIFFNQQNKKLYILTQNNLLASEKLIP